MVPFIRNPGTPSEHTINVCPCFCQVLNDVMILLMAFVAIRPEGLSVKKIFKIRQYLVYLLYFSYALFQRNIRSMASSVNCVTEGHLCSRCSTVCGCCPQWLQVGSFFCPHVCKVCAVLQWHF